MTGSKNKCLGRDIVQTASQGFCSGCGVCAVANPASISMQRMDDSSWKPVRMRENKFSETEICPFTTGITEDQIACDLFKPSGLLKHSAAIGRYSGIYFGWDNDLASRMKSSSGGVTTWVLKKLFEQGSIAGAIVVGPSINDGRFNYRLVRTSEELDDVRKSRYHPVTMEHALKAAAEIPGKIAVVGIPCFIKAIRLLQAKESFWREKIGYGIGILCGHMKTGSYTDYLLELLNERLAESERLGSNPDEIDYRRKDELHPASTYVFYAKNGKKENAVPLSGRFGTNWAYNLFMLNCCNFCDDVAAETADITLGDAWIEPFRSNYRGTNLIVVRNAELHALLEKGHSTGEITLQESSESDFLHAQGGAVRQRQESITLRLALWDFLGRWRPNKRENASFSLLFSFPGIVQLVRLGIQIQSHWAYRVHRNRSWISFKLIMAPLIILYEMLYRWRRWRNSKDSIS